MESSLNKIWGIIGRRVELKNTGGTGCDNPKKYGDEPHTERYWRLLENATTVAPLSASVAALCEYHITRMPEPSIPQ